MLRQKELKELVDYVYSTGKLVLKKDLYPQKEGDLLVEYISRTAKYINVNTRINKQYFSMIRLIWLWHYGEFPKQRLISINENRLDTRIENLLQLHPKVNREEELSHDYVCKLFRYEEDTGLLVRKITIDSRSKKGDAAGSVKEKSYLVVSVGRRLFRVHRLIWFLKTGKWPEKGKEIDHIKGSGLDNRWCNLRLLDRTMNNANSSNPRNNVSGVKGVRMLDKKSGIWKTEVSVNNKSVYIKQSKDFVEIVAHRLAVEQCLGWPMDRSPAYFYMQGYVNQE